MSVVLWTVRSLASKSFRPQQEGHDDVDLASYLIRWESLILAEELDQ